jgi:hypothetical protein
MCDIGNKLRKQLEVPIHRTTRLAIEYGVHTGALQAKTAYDLHVQLCPDCAVYKPWDTVKSHSVSSGL